MKIINGVEIPQIGLGTWLTENSEVGEVVKRAISVGYNHIDTAQAYGNEEGIGTALKELNIKRSDIFITSKVKAEIKNYDEALASISESIKKLQVDYIDLMLIHCPQPWNEYGSSYRYEKENIEVWKALEESYKKGLVRAIGVSNFNIYDLKNIFSSCTIKPMVNQCLCHPHNTPIDIINFCKENDILFEAYSPIGHGRMKDDEIVNKLASKYNKTYAQISIKYCESLDVVVLPKARSLEHLKNNLNLDFTISKEDLDLLR